MPRARPERPEPVRAPGGTSSHPVIKVRRRHDWILLIAYRLTEERAAAFVADGKASLGTDVEISGPVCEACEQSWPGEESCPGDASDS